MKKYLLALFLILAFAASACAMGPSVNKSKITWDRNTEADLGGYCLYWKVKGAANYLDTNRLCVTKDVVLPIDLMTLNLASGIYNFVVTANDTAGNESGPSNEVEWDGQYPIKPANLKVQ